MSQARSDAEQLVIDYKDLWNEQAYAKIPDIVSESFVLHDEQAPGGEVRGHDGLEEWMREFTSAFPDFHVEELDMLSRDDTVMVESTYTMTHKGALGDVPPTDREVEIQAVAKFIVENGKIQQHREYHDRLEILEQLGVMDE